MIFYRPWLLIKRTFAKSSEDRVSTLAASLAYYAVFCIAPLLVIAIRVAGIFFGGAAAQQQLKVQLSGFMGEQAAGAVLSLVTKATTVHPGSLIRTLFTVGFFVYAAIVLFDEVQDGMNIIWNVENKRQSSWWSTLRDQLLSSAIVLGMVLLFVISLVVSTTLPGLSHFASGGALGRPVGMVGTLIIFSGVFALSYKFLPDTKVAWNDVWLAAIVAAVLFTLGKYLLGDYLGRLKDTSMYGVTGSVAIVLIWVYYSARVFYFGAEFTQVYGCREDLWDKQSDSTRK
ncbi:MAG TPA: YihY/virulence factor BrkB family protein [Tepidisphaeraceae bacterium]